MKIMKKQGFPSVKNDLVRLYLSCINAAKAQPFQAQNCAISKPEYNMLVAALYMNHMYQVEAKEEYFSYILNYLNSSLLSCKTGNVPDLYSYYQEEKLMDAVRNVMDSMLDQKKDQFRSIVFGYEKNADKEKDKLIVLYSIVVKYLLFLETYCSGDNRLYSELNKTKEALVAFLKDTTFSKEDGTIITSQVHSLAQLELQQEASVLYLQLQKTPVYQAFQTPYRLRNVKRFSQAIDIAEENVLLHTWEVIVLADAIVCLFNSQGEDISRVNVFQRLFYHDFGEVFGNDIISDFKVFNAFTKKYFEKMNERDEENLKETVGEAVYFWIKNYKLGKEGYIADIMDKIAGILKVYIEIHFFNNRNFISVLKTNYNERLNKFSDLTRVQSMKRPSFLKELLDHIFVSNSEDILDVVQDDLKFYYSLKETGEILSVLKQVHEADNS